MNMATTNNNLYHQYLSFLLLVVIVLVIHVVSADDNDPNNILRQNLNNNNSLRHRRRDENSKGESEVEVDVDDEPDQKLKQKQTRIINGNQVKELRYPYFALLTSDQISTEKFRCGGVVIGPRLVLSVAHCDVFDMDQMSFQIGAYKNLTDGRTVKINSKTVHPQYNETEFLNDIVLYQLDANMDLPYYIELDRNSDGKMNGLKKEVVNYDSNSNDEDDKNGNNGNNKLVVIGFGDINPDDTITELPNSLYKVEVTYVDNKQCDIEHGNNNEITDGMLCAGGDGYDSSFGDSGGPLIKQQKQQQQDTDEAIDDDAIDAYDTDDILIGLVSWGRTMNEPGVYVRISYYYTWIRTIVCDQYLDDAPYYFECQTPSPTKEPTNPPRIFDGFKAPTSKEPTTKVPTKEPTNPPLILDGFIINNNNSNNNNGATETTTTTTKTTEVPTNPYRIPDGFKQSYYNTLISNKSNP